MIVEENDQINPAPARYAAFITLGLAGLVTIFILLFHMLNVNKVSRFPEPGANAATGNLRKVHGGAATAGGGGSILVHWDANNLQRREK